MIDKAQLLDVPRSIGVFVTVAEVEGHHTLDLCRKAVHGAYR